MSPLHSSLALGPLAVYLLLLGILNRSRRPFLTTGPRDLIALGLAAAGFLVVGPMDLFMPLSAAEWFGPYVWLLMLLLYLLCLLLAAMFMRPRLVIYNVTLDQLRPRLAQLVEQMGLEHHWAGASLALPTLGVELRIEEFALLRNVSLLANGPQQNARGWHRLAQELTRELARLEVRPNPAGLSFVAFGLLIFASLFLRLTQNPAAVAHSLLELLRVS